MKERTHEKNGHNKKAMPQKLPRITTLQSILAAGFALLFLVAIGFYSEQRPEINAAAAVKDQGGEGLGRMSKSGAAGADASLLFSGNTRTSQQGEQVVLIDPVGGGTQSGDVEGSLQEKEIALRVAHTLYQRYGEALSNNGIRLLLTRSTDTALSDADRVALADRLQATLVIRIGAEQSADAEKNGITVAYNEVFFTRGLQNASLAGLLLQEITETTGKPAGEVIAAYETDGVLRELQVPAARIGVGYETGTEDKTDMDKDTYVRSVAQGIYQAIKEALEK